jgi:hypothetical protein|tara:strand:- start:447 stop:710 length:264 start_codon:yes stop_codon:yes gene_type:complete
VTDPSGVDYSSFFFSRDGVQSDFCGQGPLVLTSGNAFNGTWTFDCVAPANVISGDYEITPFAQDVLGNYTNMNGGRSDATRANFTVT